MAIDLYPTPEQRSRFWERIVPDSATSCWNWQGSLRGNGYGSFTFWKGNLGRYWLVHRFAYESLCGPIPESLTLDHLCRNQRCVNPDHLEPVTIPENTRRARPYGKRTPKTHCKRGHEFTPENTYPRNNGTERECRTCKRVLSRRWKAERRGVDNNGSP